ncbi:hypothetical protein CDV36_010717 [Fusarium kuroshium]|uniref:Uncharacterized protein n=2 Tax=Fusarium solani species complex TaxID=232080 RepID=A0A3M2RWK8_9HYPO|nr:hypothetical protein CDV36_010717 [Fusarium kuroshium]RSL57633.1 hypothetical protein CEP51_014216 [Fusarium floridanum]
MMPFLSFLMSPLLSAAGLINQAILNIFGFTNVGVHAGSWAALFQSWIGNVSAGSFFAFFQSAAMGGYATAIMDEIVALGYASVAVHTANLALGFMGFEAGVIGGSFAAFIHSCIGNVAAGSPFAVLQSAGAGGYGMAIVSNVFGLTGLGMTVVGAVGMVGGLVSWLDGFLW